ncbi:hypothetical protein [Desulfitobacterium dehalogenans]|uniref:hypothetical protein n=1 Tax=Desulfitobacterium dehalogenans TaxID=36854 RepID=UPI001FA7DFA9|nr:hypothetical protein [Desulfitobacterium dehalogenans]
MMASQRVIDIPPEDYARNNLSMEPLSKRWGGVSSEGYHQIMVFMGYHTPVPAQELTLTVSNWIIPEGFIRSDGQVAGLSYESIVPGDAPDSFKFIFSAQPLNQWPGKVSLDIRAIQFKTSEVINIPVDWSFYVSKEGQIEVTEEQVPAVAF